MKYDKRSWLKSRKVLMSTPRLLPRVCQAGKKIFIGILAVLLAAAALAYFLWRRSVRVTSVWSFLARKKGLALSFSTLWARMAREFS